MIYDISELKVYEKGEVYMDEKEPLRMKFSGRTPDEFLDTMDALREQFEGKGINVVMNYEGKDYYTSDTTRDEMSKEIEDEYQRKLDEHQKMMEEKEQKALEEARSKMQSWREKAEKYIIPEKMEEWEKYMDEASKVQFYHGAEIDVALDVMEKLENGVPMEEIAESFSKEGYSTTLNMARNTVLRFSEKGPDFYEKTPWTNSNGEKIWTEESQKLVENQRREIRDIRAERREELKKQGINMPYNKADYLEVKPDYNVTKEGLDGVIKFIKEYQEKDGLCCVNFNGITICSNDSEKDIWTKVTGVSSKEEFEKRLNGTIDKRNKVIEASHENRELKVKNAELDLELDEERRKEQEVKEQQKSKDTQVKQ